MGWDGMAKQLTRLPCQHSLLCDLLHVDERGGHIMQSCDSSVCSSAATKPFHTAQASMGYRARQGRFACLLCAPQVSHVRFVSCNYVASLLCRHIDHRSKLIQRERDSE